VSVDTFKGQVAARAIEAGASIVNDISGCRFDPELLDVVAQMKPGYVLMHSLDRPERMQENPKYDDVLGEIMEFFAERLRVLTGAGLPESHIVLDPGIGFGKTPEHNIFLLKHIDRLTEFGLPLYVGLSNKSVWGALLQLPLEKRLHATVAATAIMYSKGVFVHRVHDAAAAHQALSVAAGIV
ncbi:MAG: dihydropteroate synthase, partial [Proteobacteria bacterium]|nr:dihydropteroate synthase [Pseudomonadota bacterium]